MFQFFVEPEQITAGQAVITGSDVNHIRNVLRMKPGRQVRISNQTGGDFLCEIAEIHPEQIFLNILEPCWGTELPVKVTLFQGLPKSDKMELVIQKSVELGVSEIVPVAMRNCVVKLDAKKAENKRARWQSIAESGAKQSKRSMVPNVKPVLEQRVVAALSKYASILILHLVNQHGHRRKTCRFCPQNPVSQRNNFCPVFHQL